MSMMHSIKVLCGAVVVSLLAATAAQAQCPGDCDDSGTVTMGELVTCANIFLGKAEVNACPSADANGDGAVPIGEVVRCSISFLLGCPGQPPTPTPTVAIATSTPTSTPVAPTATATAPAATSTPTAIPPTPTSVPTSTPTTPPAATPSATPTAVAGADCGNGLLEEGESCTSCPEDCVIANCVPSGQTISFDAYFSAGTEVTSVAIDLAYRSDRVQLPGSANAQTVRARVTGLPAGGQSIINDRDYSLRVVKSRTEPLPEGKLFTVQFDLCSGAVAPTVDDFACFAASCSDEFSLPVSDCLCTLLVP